MNVIAFIILVILHHSSLVVSHSMSEVIPC
jgi:hypothetical protein